MLKVVRLPIKMRHNKELAERRILRLCELELRYWLDFKVPRILGVFIPT